MAVYVDTSGELGRLQVWGRDRPRKVVYTHTPIHMDLRKLDKVQRNV